MNKSINEHKYFKVRLPITEKRFIFETKKYLHTITNKKTKIFFLINQLMLLLLMKIKSSSDISKLLL